MDHSYRIYSHNLPGIKYLFILWIILGLLGFLLTFIGYYVLNLDYFVKWSLMAAAPPNTAKLIGGDYTSVLAITDSGQILRCYEFTESCWIPDLDQSDTTKTCEYRSLRFSELTHPPQGIVDCVTIQGHFPEATYEISYVLDKQGNVWKWSKLSDMGGLLVPFYALFFGVVGLSIGSIIWSVRRYLIKRSFAKDQFQARSFIKFNWMWLLVVTPLLCLVSIVLLVYIAFYTAQMPAGQKSAIYTSAAGTANVQRTKDAQKYSIPVTPYPAGPAFDFVDQCQAAYWSFNHSSGVPCTAQKHIWTPAVEEIQICEVYGNLESACKQLLFTIPPSNINFINPSISGEYPVWEIRSRDHFLTILECKKEAYICDMVFSLELTSIDGRTLLGRWEVTLDAPFKEIDVDLSHFAGNKVTFILQVEDFEQTASDHNAILLNPRIENILDK